MDTSISTDKVIVSEIAQRDSSVLDLVFAMDCTSSMGPYINSAKNNIRLIVDEIVTNEKSDIHLALIEYRDHPPQDFTFVTCVHDFTDNIEEMKGWLEQCRAQGGGDTPEAVADALHEVLALSWRSEATKICILISDAPPHGLNSNNDTFPNGCPLGLDPIKIVREMVENNITIYTVGVEPPIIPYRDFFMTLAYITGGQYIPLVDATLLAQLIIGGVCEEISLNRLMTGAQQDIVREIQQAEEDEINEQETAIRINRILRSKNIRVKQMRNTRGATSKATEECYSKCVDMDEIKSKYEMSKVKSEGTMEEINYALKEDDVTVEQTKRLIQKVKNRRGRLIKSTLTESKDDETTIRRQTRKNNRGNQKQEDDNSNRHKCRSNNDTIDILIDAEDNHQKETSLHDDDDNATETRHLTDLDITVKQVRKNNRDRKKQERDNSKRHRRRSKGDAIDTSVDTKDNNQNNQEETMQLTDQDMLEKQQETVRKRRRHQTGSEDVNIPKEKTNRRLKKKSNEISDLLKIPDDTIDDNTTIQPIPSTERIHSSLGQHVQSDSNVFYLILVSVLITIIAAYLFFV